MSPLDAEPRSALARGRAYDLLGDLVRRGLSPERMPHLRAVQALRATLPEDLDLDQEAARHQDTFTRQLLPWESVWLDPSARLDAAPAVRLRQLLLSTGLASNEELREEPDHLGQELRWLSRACGAELSALREGDGAALVRARDLQRELLDQHLLRWLPALAIAAEQLPPSWCTEAVSLALLTAAEHRQALPGRPEPWSLPEQPLDLDEPRTGLRDIGDWLVHPGRTGLLLSHHALRELGRESDIPGGFGDRGRVAENLLATAAHLGKVPELLRAIELRLLAWLGRYGEMAELGLGAQVEPWAQRCTASLGVLKRLRTQVALEGGAFADPDSNTPQEAGRE